MVNLYQQSQTLRNLEHQRPLSIMVQRSSTCRHVQLLDLTVWQLPTMRALAATHQPINSGRTRKHLRKRTADGTKFKKTCDRYAISDFQMSIGITYVIFFAILLMLAFIFGTIFVNMS